MSDLIDGVQGVRGVDPLNPQSPSNPSSSSSPSNISRLSPTDVAELKRIEPMGRRGEDGRRLETRKVRKSQEDIRNALDVDSRSFARTMLLTQSFLRMAEEAARLRGEMVKRCLRSEPATARAGVREIRAFERKIAKAFGGFDEELRKQVEILRKDAKLTAVQKAAAKRLEAEFREWQIQASGYKTRQERLRKAAREETTK